MCEVVEDFSEIEKIEKGFTSADTLEEVDIDNGVVPRPTFVNKDMNADYKAKLIKLLKEYVDSFTWSYSEMTGLSHELLKNVELFRLYIAA
jgi:hypothetical protein